MRVELSYRGTWGQFQDMHGMPIVVVKEFYLPKGLATEQIVTNLKGELREPLERFLKEAKKKARETTLPRFRVCAMVRDKREEFSISLPPMRHVSSMLKEMSGRIVSAFEDVLVPYERRGRWAATSNLARWWRKNYLEGKPASEIADEEASDSFAAEDLRETIERSLRSLH